LLASGCVRVVGTMQLSRTGAEKARLLLTATTLPNYQISLDPIYGRQSGLKDATVPTDEGTPEVKLARFAD